MIRVGKRALKGKYALPIAIASFLALFFGQAWFPIVILAAGIFGALLALKAQAPKLQDDPNPAEAAPSATRAFITAGVWLAAWFAPVALSFAALGPDHVLSKIGRMFSTLAIVTFGGAYATLAYLQQEAVKTQSWLSAGQMIDGLGLAETTPGPLVLVNQFVGFMAGWQSGQGGLVLAFAGAAMASWCTFAPSFVWIFAGAPYAERLRANRFANGALQAISAAVLGVIANLAIWFALHVVFARVGGAYWGLGLAVPLPVWASLDVKALSLAAFASLMLFRFKLGVLSLVSGAALAGIATQSF
jgi:chromate transporter